MTGRMTRTVCMAATTAALPWSLMHAARQDPAGGVGTIALSQLTPSADTLPEGCRLKSLDPVPQVRQVSGPIRVFHPAPSMQPPGATTNPWIGVDPSSLAWLRGRVDGRDRYRTPDAPLIDRRDRAALMERLAAGVEEGYAATYEQEWASDIGVHAVRLAPGVAARPPYFNRTRRGADRRFALGAIQILLAGDNGACAKAVEGHVRGLGALLIDVF